MQTVDGSFTRACSSGMLSSFFGVYLTVVILVVPVGALQSYRTTRQMQCEQKYFVPVCICFRKHSQAVFHTRCTFVPGCVDNSPGNMRPTRTSHEDLYGCARTTIECGRIEYIHRQNFMRRQKFKLIGKSSGACCATSKTLLLSLRVPPGI